MNDVATTTDPVAPGSRVRVRDEEWIVEKCLPVPTGGYAVHVQGVSELVRYHKAIFLTELDRVEPLRPEDTVLVADPSPEYRQTRLFVETLLRRTPPTDPYVRIGHRAAMEPMPYQFVPARKALQQLRQRILVADGLGLGKTIEAGVLLSELIKRGRGRRIMVVAIRSMLAQFQQELWARFTIPLVRLDSEGLQRVQAKIPSNRNPFSHFDRCIISVDTLKNNARYRAWLEQTRWDAIVVDECQNVANRGSQREALARLLAATCDTLILTSATPHNGRAESFANLMRMLDPTAIADESNFTHEDVQHLFVRRFKKDVEAEAGRAFTEREVHRHEVQASPDEEQALAALRGLTVHNLSRNRAGEDKLFRWVLVKAFLSSPQACVESIDARLGRIDKALGDTEKGPHPRASELREDAEQLREVRSLVERCLPVESFSKLQRFFAGLRKLGFDGSASSPRVIVFSERSETLRTLHEAVLSEFGIDEGVRRVATFEASLSDQDQKDLVDSFGKKESPLRLLLASDAASEGVNLHYYCNQLFHFDVPWSLIRLEQRMGRIDRFGQHQTPHLHYLLTSTEEQGADQLIVDRLIEKEQQVHRQLGEAGVVLGIYDAEAEEDHITQQIADGTPPLEAIPEEPLGYQATQADIEDDEATHDATSGGVDLLTLFQKAAEQAPQSEPLDRATRDPLTLFSGDYEFAKSALQTVQNHPVGEGVQWEADDGHQALRVDPPESFRRFREEFLPEEAVPARNEPYRLVADRGTVEEQIESAREHEGEWPSWHLLWEQHPVMEWLLDALATVYGRNEAPVLAAPRLGERRAVYLFQTALWNQRSQPVLTKWFGVQLRLAKSAAWEGIVPLEEVLDTTGLRDGLTNPGTDTGDAPILQEHVAEAVQRARDHALEAYNESLPELRKQVRALSRRVERWKQQRLEALEARERRYRERNQGKLPVIAERRLADERAYVERFARDHNQWIDGVVRHGDPYVRLVAVFAGDTEA